MPLTLKGKSKARLEIYWNEEVPVRVIITPANDDIVLYKEDIHEVGCTNIELHQLDFSSLFDAKELEIVASIEDKNKQICVQSSPLKIQKCHLSGCMQWGHSRDDGYCKHCGRRIKDYTYSCGFEKLELSTSSVILWNGKEGTLTKKKEKIEKENSIFSEGKYKDATRPLRQVKILEEKYDPEIKKRFLKLEELLRKAIISEKQWALPLACFHEEHNRIVWIYYPSYPENSIDAMSYITKEDEINIFTSTDIVNIGIQLCSLIQKIHVMGYTWGSLKFSDVIITKEKNKEAALCLTTKEIALNGPPLQRLLESCFVPWELFWENSLDPRLYQATEVYIVASFLYFLAAKATNLLGYNSLSYQNSLPSLKLFKELDIDNVKKDPINDYFESVINQALILDPYERSYRNIQEFKTALESILLLPKSKSILKRYIFDIGSSLDVGREKNFHDFDQNQDDLFVTTVNIKRKNWGIFVLCDGISTATLGSGDKASRIVTNVFREWWRNTGEAEKKKICSYAKSDISKAYGLLNTLVDEANAQIKELVESIGDEDTIDSALIMGTTVTTGIIYEDMMAFAWVGDSPIYRISKHGWERLNFEDNERNFRITRGMPLEESFIEGGNALTRCVGAHYYEEDHIYMNLGYTYLYPKEHILICSDGIPDYIEQEASYAFHENYQMLRMSSIIQQYSEDSLLDANALATILISVVNGVGGGYDNLSAILIHTLIESDISLEKNYLKLRSLSPTTRKIINEANLETQKINPILKEELSG